MLLFLSTASLRAQVSLVKDINAYPSQFSAINDYSERFCSCGDNLFFDATTDKGRELWRTDGTADGTILLKDIYKGFDYGLGGPLFCNGNGIVYFIGRDASNGSELWASDGTANGTKLVKDVTPGAAGLINILGFFGTTVYFLTDHDADDQMEIWKSDGSANGTTLVTTLNSPDHYNFDATMSSDTHFFFNLLNTSQNKFELWGFNVASGTTEKLLENAFILDSENFGNTVQFAVADQTDYNNSLWSSDGTPGGTTAFKDFGNSNVQSLFKFNDKLIFTTYGTTWITDGTDAGTTILASGHVEASAIIENNFYGFGYDFATNSNRLLKFDGSTVETTVMNGTLGEISIFREIPVLDNRLVLQYYDATVGTELGISDNDTRESVALLKDINPGIENSAPRAWATFKNRVYFLANDDLYGSQIWSTDGTENGTSILKPTTSTGNAFIFKSARLAINDDKLYFIASTQADFNSDLFTSDGTEAGTSIKFDFESGTPFFLGSTDKDLIYLKERKLYKTNGSSQPVTVVKDLTNDLFGFSLNETYYTLGNKMLFALFDYGGPTEKGTEFWVTDGTESGTQVLKDIYPGSTSGVSGKGIVMGSKFVFDGNESAHGSELWTSDGTPAGTLLLKDISLGTSDSKPSHFSTLSDKVIFSATTSDSGREVWITDGTEQGTNLLADIVAGPIGSDAKDFTSLGTVVLFNAYDEAKGWTLWKTDGTTPGTKTVKDIIPGNDRLRFPGNFTAVGSKLFFVADDGVHGSELWISDGTAEGTYFIDIAPGIQSSDPSMFTALKNGIVYFKANGELWRTNGTASATSKVSDLEPLEMIAMDNSLYFTAPHPDFGVELFKAEFTKFDQQITFTSITDKTLGDVPFQIIAAASSGLPIVITSGDELAIEDHTATITKPGTVQISFEQAGDDFYNAAQTWQTFCILPVKPSITLTGLDVGQPVLNSSANLGNQWFEQEVAISNATSQTFTPSEDSSYKVNVTIDGCTSEFSDEAIVIIMGVETFGDGISVFPNPVKETLRIETTGDADNLSVTITDVNGKAMRTYDLGGNETVDYSLAGYPAGVYIIRIATESGVSYKKIIKEQ